MHPFNVSMKIKEKKQKYKEKEKRLDSMEEAVIKK